MGDSPSPEEDQEEWLTLSLSTIPKRRQPEVPPQLLAQQQQCTPSIPSTNFQQMPSVTPLYSFYVSPSSFQGSYLPHQYQPSSSHPPRDQPSSSEVHPKCESASQEEDNQDQEPGPSRPGRGRRLQGRGLKDGKMETITPPYPWATSSRATVHSIQHLLSQNMVSITGSVQCKRCDEKYDIAFDLKEKFCQVARFIAENRYMMHDRAPSAWTNPVLPTCNRCGQENSLRPEITKKRTINWLFLLLGQMIGCCTLSHLKYFCKHTKNHRTAAKDRLIYLTYLGLCKQLNPDGPFDV